ncbi:MAG: diacylglycerol kinase family lipid kinase [Bacteroidia bacterium]|nr:diacylglycerol kinase family lipid kinase [Bacteroidia bacterium]
MESWFCIVNPAAAGGTAPRTWQQFENQLIAQGQPYTAHLTQATGHATSLVHQAIREGARTIIIIGGDGTVNEAVNGLMTQDMVPSHAVRLGFVRAGTGTDWARTHQFPARIPDLVSRMMQGSVRMQDAGKISYTRDGEDRVRYFNNVAGMAFDGYVVERTQTQSKHGLAGQAFYLMGLLRHMNTFSSPVMRIEGPDFVMEAPCFCLNAGICRYSGGGMQLVPRAIPDDGLLDITFIEHMTPAEVVRNIARLYNGTLYTHRKVHHFKTPHITVSGITPLEADGELLGTTPARIEVIPAALCVLGVP